MGRVIVVVGMHRSGTSLVTRGLQAMGVQLGDNLSVDAAPDNAKGHWEDRDVLELNRRLMRVLALEWDVIGAGDEALMAAPSLMPLVEQARSLVEAKTAGNTAWAFKDPRTARLWPFWHRVLAQGRWGKPDFVWVIRHPLPVARSLARRDGCTPLKSHLLWLRHNTIPFRDIAANRHVVVDYDRMLRQPRVELQRMAGALTLEVEDEPAIAGFADRFLDPGLRHFGHDGESTASTGLGLVAARAYRILEPVACDSARLTDPDFQARWRDVCQEAATFADVAPRVDITTVAASSLREIENRLREEQRRSQSDHATKLREQVAETLRGQFAEVGRRVGEAETMLSESQQKRHEALASGLREQMAETLRGQFAEVGRRVGEAETMLSESQQKRHEALASGLREQMAETLRGQFAEVGRRVGEAETMLSESQQKRHEALASQHREQFAEVGRRIEQVQSQLLTVESGLERSRADLAFANELLNKERYSVLKPLLRRTYRFGARTVQRLPAPVEQRLRRLKRKLLPTSMATTVTIGGVAEAGQVENDIGVFGDFDRSPGCYDILVCPVIDWHFRFQRPQQLAKQLGASGHRVCYLSTTFEPTDAPSFSIQQSPATNVVLVKLGLPGNHPSIYKDLLTDRQRELLSVAIGRLVEKGRLGNLVAIVDLPFWRSLVEAIPGCLMVYDCMDYHGGFSTNSPKLIEEEPLLLKQADLVITSSAGLSQIVGQTAENVLIRNAGEIAYFGKTAESPAYPSERLVAGYLGAIADWFDIDLVAAAARRFPDWDFVLVGSTDFCDVSRAEKLANVKLIGEVSYDRAAAWVHSFDVAMIPFKLTKLTQCTSPVKIYEYLAAGKPVVATGLPEVRLMGEVAHVADTGEGFMQLLEAAMAERDDSALAARRRQWAAAHDWKDRADRLQKAIGSAFPKVSVIVLTYNNLSFTKACLHSLEANTRYPDWELVLVDNASTDGSCEFLADYSIRNAHAKLIQNDENLGFAAGNNRGLEAAAGEYLVVLNNDTYVTRGWLLDLVRHLRQDPNLGLVGTVTNNIGNEAKIDIHYKDMAEMQQAAYAYTSCHAREELDVNVVGFFCTAMPRVVFETVGGLDERFGLGFFEDDDYCRRVAEAGYRITIAEDVFVHHHLSASFDLLDRERRQALFDRNKALYEEKWGEWTPHRYRDQ